ncbi:uncharacterized protein LOC129802338 isoform X2 [Phlebotomus papatasi]|uniref:uncharacterized protein LOC129802338 isoform X2 n=1 Tax=Phlebotomus papatasi TaxID=29031 RepID=UPI002484136B|nr:uncharacterized protein LOC129802338 isoform X2 [Phlebotomus papatasi]XP_055704080.1 uncharacterized protein LOC129802338 isoform X2 [Phlebotomus papatasi]
MVKASPRKMAMIVGICLVATLVASVTSETPSLSSQTLSLSGREKPELSEHLSAVIGEDVAKSIEYKRQVEEAELRSTARTLLLTTPSTESTAKSRIQIKTAPNGVDYEYEYVYYYYDEDDDTNKTTTPSERGRSRYQSIERTSKAPLADNSRTELNEEERLPQNTRFPPRNSPELITEAPVKISVKHPSLELVDSDTFNTADNRNLYGSQTDGPMEKAAFDLYVILQNEKMAVDATEIATTEEPTTPDITTEFVEVTTMTQEVTTTTRRTTEAPSPAPTETRRVAAQTRNRFKLRPTPSTTTEVTERATFAAKSRYGSGKPGGGNRANSFGRTLSTSVPSTTAPTEPESRSSFGSRATRTRNRFNLRSTTEASAVSEETSTASRLTRPRGTFSSRTRTRATTPSLEEVTNRTTETTTARPRVALPSRSSNRLLAPRKNLLRSSTAPPSTELPTEDLEESDVESQTSRSRPEEIEKTESTTSQSGINRLRNRPRINIHPAGRPKAPVQNVFAARKVNPLIRRPFGNTSSTSESPAEAEETDAEEEPEIDAEEPAIEVTEAPSSEAPRGLGLLGTRRRLPLRRPGTINTA